MRLLGLAPLLCALVAPVIASAPAAAAPAAAAPAAPAANVDFDFAMYGALRARAQDGNLFASPASMREALGIAYLGAHGTTADEMVTALHLDADRTKAVSQAKDELAGFQAARGASQLSIANRLWADQAFKMNDSFTRDARDAFGAPVETVDFLRSPNAARLTINGWVETQTNGKIKDLLAPPAVTSNTSLVITNAIWFKGTWEKTFAKTATNDAPFHVDATTNVDVPMMHQTAVFSYAAVPTAGMKVLEMPYGKSDLAMDVLLPDDPTGLSKIEEKLTSRSFVTWTSALAKQRVAVSFPKVKITWGGSVKPELQKLGMRTAFVERAADFTGIADIAARDAGKNLFVSDVVHKAFVAIDEEGTEAAAATGVVMATAATSFELPPVRFDADHPFVFVIRDVKRGRVLFMGRVNNPKA